MSKKVKRQATITPVTPMPSSVSVIQKTPAGSFSRGGLTTEFKPDYAYVKKDLKRIGALAGSFFIILVVLSFFLK
jgi:hypothetical protein